MSSPTHDVMGVTAAIAGLAVLTDERLDPTGLFVALVCMAVLGVVECMATQKQRAEERRRKPARVALLAEGVDPEEIKRRVPRARWNAPRRPLRRTVRLVAYVGAGVTAWPLGVAMACSRLPDQLEVGGIDHRELTHRLVTAAVLLGGIYAGLMQWPETQPYAPWVTGAVGVGILVHYVADMLTLDGLAVLWPLVRRELHLLPKGWRVRTGSVVDTAILLLCAVGAGWLAIGMAPVGWSIPVPS